MESYEKRALGAVGVLILLGLLAVLKGCDAGIPIDPEVDVCAIEGVEECCMDCICFDNYQEGYDDGFAAAMASDECNSDCDDDSDSDSDSEVHPPRKKPVHRHHDGCRHRRQHKDLKKPIWGDTDDPLEGLE